MHINMNKIFYEKTYIFQNKKKHIEEWHCFTFLQMSGLIEDRCNLKCVSIFNLLQSAV